LVPLPPFSAGFCIDCMLGKYRLQFESGRIGPFEECVARVTLVDQPTVKNDPDTDAPRVDVSDLDFENPKMVDTGRQPMPARQAIGAPMACGISSQHLWTHAKTTFHVPQMDFRLDQKLFAVCKKRKSVGPKRHFNSIVLSGDKIEDILM